MTVTILAARACAKALMAAGLAATGCGLAAGQHQAVSSRADALAPLPAARFAMPANQAALRPASPRLPAAPLKEAQPQRAAGQSGPLGLVRLPDPADSNTELDGSDDAPAARGDLSAVAAGREGLPLPQPIGDRRVRRVCRVTAYADRGLTASGVRVAPGQCAAPEDIPFGARVFIPALNRSYVVTDRTAQRFRHNTVDLYVPSRSQCKRFGRHYLDCEFELPARNVDLPEYADVISSPGR
jgi:3D (Asp-Asp-Asp) domain-containing protein